MNFRITHLLILVLAIVSFSCSIKTVGSEQVNLVPGSSPIKSEINKDAHPEILIVPTVDKRPITKPVADNMPIDHKIKIGTLSNGMKYYIRKNAYPENRVALRLALAAGSINEDPGQEGMAHFIEHMCFNGTKSFAKDSLVKYLESVGTKFGPDLNAYTSFDETVYMLEVRADDQVQLNNGLLILKEWAGDVSFDNEEIDKERGVVISEWRTRLSPGQRMAQEYFPVMYHKSKYAKRLPIGSTDVIENGDYDTFKKYYRDWYRPNLMAIVVVGDIDVDIMEKKVKTLFGQLKNPISPREREEANIPFHKETLVSINTDSEAAFSTVNIMNKFKHIPVLTKRDFKEWMKRSLYNDMLSARLRELSQKKNPPFIFGYSGYSSNVGDIDMYRSYVSVEKGGWLKGMDAILTENQRVLQHGFTITEYERAQARMIQGAEKQEKEKNKLKSGRLAMKYVYNFLNDNPIPNPAQHLALLKTYLRNMKLADINGLAKEWNKKHSRVVVLTGPVPENGQIPTESEIHKLINKIEKIDVDAYQDKVVEGDWLMENLVSGTVSKDSTVADLNLLDVIYLSNGIKVILKSTDFKNDEILMSAWSDGGNSLYGMEKFKQSSFTAPIINQSGVSEFTGIDLNKMFAGKDMSLQTYISTYEEGLRGKSSIKDLDWFMQWVNYSFSEPRIDSDAFASFKTKYASIYGNLLSDPKYYFQNEMSKIKFNNNYRSLIPTSEDINMLDKKLVFEIHRERFANPADFTFCFVGNFEMDEMKIKAAKYLGSLKTNDIKEDAMDTKLSLASGLIEKRWKKGKAPKSFVDISYHGDIDNMHEEAYAFNTMVKILSVKLRERLREDMGGVYGVRANGSIKVFPKQEYVVNISFVADPPMVDSLIIAVKEEIAKIKDNGVSQSDINKVLELQRQSKIKSLKENNYWLSKLQFFDQHEIDPQEIKMEVLEEKMRTVNPSIISKLAMKYFNKNSSLWLIQDPE